MERHPLSLGLRPLFRSRFDRHLNHPEWDGFQRQPLRLRFIRRGWCSVVPAALRGRLLRGSSGGIGFLRLLVVSRLSLQRRLGENLLTVRVIGDTAHVVVVAQGNIAPLIVGGLWLLWWRWGWGCWWRFHWFRKEGEGRKYTVAHRG